MLSPKVNVGDLVTFYCGLFNHPNDGLIAEVVKVSESSMVLDSYRYLLRFDGGPVKFTTANSSMIEPVFTI